VQIVIGIYRKRGDHVYNLLFQKNKQMQTVIGIYRKREDLN
jgi:hypothetical protein